jgi:hypothetical protein
MTRRYANLTAEGLLATHERVSSLCHETVSQNDGRNLLENSARGVI